MATNQIMIDPSLQLGPQQTIKYVNPTGGNPNSGIAASTRPPDVSNPVGEAFINLAGTLATKYASDNAKKQEEEAYMNRIGTEEAVKGYQQYKDDPLNFFDMSGKEEYWKTQLKLNAQDGFSKFAKDIEINALKYADVDEATFRDSLRNVRQQFVTGDEDMDNEIFELHKPFISNAIKAHSEARYAKTVNDASTTAAKIATTTVIDQLKNGKPIELTLPSGISNEKALTSIWDYLNEEVGGNQNITSEHLIKYTSYMNEKLGSDFTNKYMMDAHKQDLERLKRDDTKLYTNLERNIGIIIPKITVDMTDEDIMGISGSQAELLDEYSSSKWGGKQNYQQQMFSQLKTHRDQLLVLQKKSLKDQQAKVNEASAVSQIVPLLKARATAHVNGETSTVNQIDGVIASFESEMVNTAKKYITSQSADPKSSWFKNNDAYNSVRVPSYIKGDEQYVHNYKLAKSAEGAEIKYVDPLESDIKLIQSLPSDANVVAKTIDRWDVNANNIDVAVADAKKYGASGEFIDLLHLKASLPGVDSATLYGMHRESVSLNKSMGIKEKASAIENTINGNGYNDQNRFLFNSLKQNPGFMMRLEKKIRDNPGTSTATLTSKLMDEEMTQYSFKNTLNDAPVDNLRVISYPKKGAKGSVMVTGSPQEAFMSSIQARSDRFVSTPDTPESLKKQYIPQIEDGEFVNKNLVFTRYALDTARLNVERSYLQKTGKKMSPQEMQTVASHLATNMQVSASPVSGKHWRIYVPGLAVKNGLPSDFQIDVTTDEMVGIGATYYEANRKQSIKK